MRPFRWQVLLPAALGALLLGWACSSYDAARDVEGRVARHMATADSLERAGNLREAMLEYSLVAQHYPESKRYQMAVHKTALLALDPRNPNADDSTAIYWLNTYLHLPGNPPAAQDAQIQLSLLQHISALQATLARAHVAVDTLTQLVRHQSTQLSSQAQRLQEAEAQLKQAQQELARLKEVDVQLSRTRREP